jgi:hypothetical protein
MWSLRLQSCELQLFLMLYRGVVAMSSSDKNRERKFHLGGWILFLVCAGFFIASSIDQNSILGLIGSIIFLVACVVFIIPLMIKGKRD